MTFHLHLRRARSLLPAALLAAAAAGPAAAQDESSYRLYRCTVLGDAPACLTAPSLVPADRTETFTVAGPYARYLIHLGQDPARAIEAARAYGEVPVRRTVRVTTRSLSPQEAHERYLGRLATPQTRYEVLAEVPLDAADTQACAGGCDSIAR